MDADRAHRPYGTSAGARLRRILLVAGQPCVVDAPVGAVVEDLAEEFGTPLLDGSTELAMLPNGHELFEGTTIGRRPRPVSGAPRWTITVASGPDSLRKIELAAGDQWVLGRANRAGRDGIAALGGEEAIATLWRHDAGISARHLAIGATSTGVFVADCGSRNGTELGNRALGPTGERWEPEVVVRAGRSTLRCDQSQVGSTALNTHDHESFDTQSGTIALYRRPAVRLLAPLAVRVPMAQAVARARVRFRPSALIGPVVGGLAMAMLLDPRFAAFALLSPVMMLVNLIDDRRAADRERRTGERDFATAFAEFVCATFDAASVERESRRIKFVDLGVQLARAEGAAPGLWGARLAPNDVCEVRIGVGSSPFEPALLESGPRAKAVVDHLARLTLADVPIAVRLDPVSCIAIVGHEGENVARAIAMQLAATFGPSDLAVVADDNGSEPLWSQLLPHRVDLHAALTEPGAMRLEGRRLVLVQFVGDLTPSIARRRLLRAQFPSLACFVVVRRADRVPAESTAIIETSTSPFSSVETLATATIVDDLIVDALDEELCEHMAMAIARWRDPELLADDARLPRSVALVDVLSLLASLASTSETKPEGANGGSTARRWRSADRSQRSLTVPLGVGADGVQTIDLVTDGPHALVAGTTGSGKSELLRTLIAGLAASYPPDIVTFVLVDYKGGSAFAECAVLPHTVGFVTDLDDGLAARALESLEAELRFRESVLRSAGARDLEHYAGLLNVDPVPRLLVVIDELASLVRDLPDFISALVSLAQRGRSLGLHLILATQRPAGTINDAIRANTNIRIALRVQDAADSVDVIGDASAARLARRIPGRALVRLGPGELSTVQVAAAGLASTHDRVVVRSLDGSVPASGERKSTRARELDSSTALARLTEEIAEAFQATRGNAPRRPWLEPLATLIPWSWRAESTRNADFDKERSPFSVRLGYADSPVQQWQGEHVVDLTLGHLCVIGTLGSGVTNTLRTAVLSLAATNAPTELHLYILDFVGQELGVLATLPHVAAVVGQHEEERRERLVARLELELERRRSTPFNETDEMPGSRAGEPGIVVVVDGWSTLRSSTGNPSLIAVGDALQRLMTDGPNFGIRFMIGTDRAASVPSVVAPSIAHRLVLRPADMNEASAGGVRFSASAARVVGRGLVVGSPGLEVQVFGSSGDDVRTLRDHLVRRTDDGEHLRLPLPVEVLEEVVSLESFDGLVPRTETEPTGVVSDPWEVPFGKGSDLGARKCLSLRSGEPVLIGGPRRSGRSTALNTLAVMAPRVIGRLAVVMLHPVNTVPPRVAPHIDLMASVTEFTASIAELLQRGTPVLALVDDAERIEDPQGLLAALAVNRDPRLRLVIAGRADVLRAAYGHWSGPARRTRLGLALRPNIETDGELWQMPLPRRLKIRGGPGRGVLLDDGRFEVIQVATT